MSISITVRNNNGTTTTHEYIRGKGTQEPISVFTDNGRVLKVFPNPVSLFTFNHRRESNQYRVSVFVENVHLETEHKPSIALDVPAPVQDGVALPVKGIITRIGTRKDGMGGIYRLQLVAVSFRENAWAGVDLYNAHTCTEKLEMPMRPNKTPIFRCLPFYHRTHEDCTNRARLFRNELRMRDGLESCTVPWLRHMVGANKGTKSELVNEVCFKARNSVLSA
jgi:hypothetical protein